MCEKVSQVDSSKDDILHGLSRYYKRMHEQLATYIEMLRFLEKSGVEAFKNEVTYMRENNKVYFNYYKNLSYKNEHLGYFRIINYSKEKIQLLINCLLLIGRDAFNIDVTKLGLESITTLSQLQTVMSEGRCTRCNSYNKCSCSIDCRLDFNPNRRFRKLIQTISWVNNEFVYDQSVIECSTLESYEIDEYIQIVEQNFPSNFMVPNRLTSFYLKEDNSNTFGLPDVAHSFPFLEIEGENYDTPEIKYIANPEELFDLEDIKYIDVLDCGSFLFVYITLNNGQSYTSMYVDDESNTGFLLPLQLVNEKRAILQFHNFYIFKYPNWKDLLGTLPNNSYILISTSITSSVHNIQKYFNGVEFTIVKMDGYNMLVMRNNTLFLIQPIISQLSEIIKNAFIKHNSNIYVESFDNLNEIVDVGRDMMLGIVLGQNISKVDFEDKIKKSLGL
ncbi:hypothetical protein [Streptococcus sciuri]|uniref:Uncharacterized protein n=1 Tax=Streptococcus sciuri TaxID=2973939 RepID=A0ABT2F523_9STRE|nr:hypothetical protein [Streptococcus sciuri]MCS4487548.1 hypothetical protein [Streptococcus sciuri]